MDSASSPFARRRGYTLIELLLVVALLGLAGALLVPHMVGRDRFQIQAAVRQIIGDLSFAQSDALAHQEHRRVHFYDDGSGYCIIRVTGDNYTTAWEDFDPDAIEYIDDPLGRNGQDGRYIIDFTTDDRFAGVQITDVNVDGAGAGPEGDIVYDPLGGTLRAVGAPGPPGTGGSITVTSGPETITIEVSPFTGKLTVVE